MKIRNFQKIVLLLKLELSPLYECRGCFRGYKVLESGVISSFVRLKCLYLLGNREIIDRIKFRISNIHSNQVFVR